MITGIFIHALLFSRDNLQNDLCILPRARQNDLFATTKSRENADAKRMINVILMPSVFAR